MPTSIPKYQSLTFEQGDCGLCDTTVVLEGDVIPLVVKNVVTSEDGIFLSKDAVVEGNNDYNFSFDYDVPSTGIFTLQILNGTTVVYSQDITTPATGTISYDFYVPQNATYTFRFKTNSVAIIASNFTLCNFKLRKYTNSISIGQAVIDSAISQGVDLSIAQNINFSISQTVNI